MTIMVLDLRRPAGQDFGDLKPLVPKLLVYALSFTFLAIYWNNHHHLMHVVERIYGRVLWANMGLLFSLSLTPAATAWFGEHPSDTAPVVVYGLVLLLSAIAYFLLTRSGLASSTRRVHDWPSRSAMTARDGFRLSPMWQGSSWRCGNRGWPSRTTLVSLSSGLCPTGGLRGSSKVGTLPTPEGRG